ncbi:GerAB/ArcD/ProY family transporter [Brevibacillus choshinensis]|uniref:Endospore germination permease n=1 Tax=Brevibacillus choshinensis TaxID=54911 RepID=A0ABX7FQH3_BRECH|nr:endospore germination permease [Brevibacillus choshinensis]QRG68351.1 endospore germination permease [Brevibacillus choshinensis]
MIPENRKISPLQLMFVIIQSQVGAGILSLPYQVHLSAKGDSWISMLLSGVLVQILIVGYWMLMSRNPGSTLFRLTTERTGAVFGFLINLCYIGYFLFIATLIQLNYYAIISKWAYPNTPKWLLLGLMFLVSAYLCKQSLQVIARFYILLSFLLIPVIILLILAISKGHLIYLLPIGQAGLGNIFLGIKSTIVAMTGFEAIFVLFPYVQGSPKVILKKLMAANLLVTLLYTMTIFAAITIFNSKQLMLIPEPVLYMLKALSFIVIERLEFIFLSFWITKVISSSAIFIFLSAVGISHMLKKQSHTRLAVPVSMIPFVIALWADDPFITDKMADLLVVISPVIFIIIPAVLLVISSLQKGKGRQKTA